MRNVSTSLIIFFVSAVTVFADINIPAKYTVTVGNYKQDKKVVPVDDKLSIVYIDFKNESALIKATAQEMAKHINPSVDILVTPEANTIALVYELSKLTGKPYLVISKKQRPDMRTTGAINVSLKSITTKEPQKLWLSAEQIARIRGKRVQIIDDVVSTGGTMNALRELITLAGGKLIDKPLVGFFEGEKRDDIVAVGGLLPLYRKEATSPA